MLKMKMKKKNTVPAHCLVPHEGFEKNYTINKQDKWFKQQ